LFTKEQRRSGTGAGPPALGPGLAVTSALDPAGCLRALGRTLLSFGVPEYTHLPTFTGVSWDWTGDPVRAPAPQTVIICADRTGDDLLAAFWPESGGSRIGLLPLTGGDEQAGRLGSSLLAAWRLRDTSLSGAAGGLEAGLIRLAPPTVPGGYAEEIVAAAGYRPSRRNTQIVLRTAGSLFLARAQQFIEHRQPRAARRFMRRHSLPEPMNALALQEILDDLAGSDPGLLPFLQWMPVRTRALLLECCQDRGTFWGDLDR
jgi:hypothetical protein